MKMKRQQKSEYASPSGRAKEKHCLLVGSSLSRTDHRDLSLEGGIKQDKSLLGRLSLLIFMISVSVFVELASAQPKKHKPLRLPAPEICVQIVLDRSGEMMDSLVFERVKEQLIRFIERLEMHDFLGVLGSGTSTTIIQNPQPVQRALEGVAGRLQVVTSAKNNVLQQTLRDVQSIVTNSFGCSASKQVVFVISGSNTLYTVEGSMDTRMVAASLEKMKSAGADIWIVFVKEKHDKELRQLFVDHGAKAAVLEDAKGLGRFLLDTYRALRAKLESTEKVTKEKRSDKKSLKSILDRLD